MSNLENKRIVLIVSGGIAAYKALELVRRLRDGGASVRVVMTEAAQRFVGQLSFQALSGEPVHTDLLDPAAEAAMGHIEIARWADGVVVAPATADFLARLRAGAANDLASTICLATSAPILLAPAMNQQMWQNMATKDNVATLIKRGLRSVGPDSGAQACGEFGPGRMAEPVAIAAALADLFVPQTLSGIRVLVTAGPTHEAIDPVRYLTNRSTGKMGFALAQAALEAGAEVILIHGPVSLSAPSGAAAIAVVSADEMFHAVMENIKNIDIFISCAAVADYRIESPATQKRKKNDTSLSLTLTPTRDILKSVTAQSMPPFAVGFAAETENLLEHARSKLERKSLDMIAANQVGVKGLGFESSDNELHVLWKGGQQHLAKAPKEVIARQLVGLIARVHGQKES
ncbi:MAG: bifunctional phosphopantothenoylcysteine decarboxylase/phosphopantothenate--cysteine ligase CoaBC [Proteobacteria bacterium]|nr:bifunctional phosphopantothenoylcysteine decarboxylase/phosphopantothenate--cysteine ligase CoaBC [Pseudomonadota bacterium]